MGNAVPFFYDTNNQVVIELEDGMVVGRNKDCDIPVVDHKVSGKHFEIHIQDDIVSIVDLESSNKTKLNGEFLSPKKETKLAIKDHVNFGSQKFLYFFESIDDFLVPEVTSTLQISSTADCAEDLFSSSKLEYQGKMSLTGKPKLSDLRNSKSRLDDLEKMLKSAISEFEEFDHVRRSRSENSDLLKNSKEQLENSPYSNKEEIDKEISSFEFSISEFNETINEAKQQIETCSNEIAKINQSILKAKQLSVVIDEIKNFEENEAKLSVELEKLEKKDIETLKDQLQSEFDREKENYKGLQNNYSLALGSNKKKSS